MHGKQHDYYGFPVNPGVSAGVKIGADAAGTICTPDTRNFNVNTERLEAASDFLRKYIPKVL